MKAVSSASITVEPKSIVNPSKCNGYISRKYGEGQELKVRVLNRPDPEDSSGESFHVTRYAPTYTDTRKTEDKGGMLDRIKKNLMFILHKIIKRFTK